MRTLVLATMLGASVAAAAKSQPPTPSPTQGRYTPQNQSSSTQQEPTPDPRGTNESPLVVQVTPTTKTDEDTAKEEAEQDERATQQRWTITSIVVAGLIGITQAVLIGIQVLIAKKQNRIINQQSDIMAGQRAAADTQSGYMRDGLAETRASINEAARSAKAMESMAASMFRNAQAAQQAAEASRRQADIADQAMRIAHRAHIIVQGVSLRLEPGKEPEFKFRFINAGTSLARITEQLVDFGYAQELPDAPSYGPVTPEMSGPLVLAGRESKRFTLNSDHLPEFVSDALADGRMHVFMWGRITYLDIFGTQWVTGFCFRYNFQRKMWAFHYKPGYYYESE